VKLAAVGIALLAAVALSWLFYQSRVANPRVVLELRQRCLFSKFIRDLCSADRRAAAR
jgi:hypothetical protein